MTDRRNARLYCKLRTLNTEQDRRLVHASDGVVQTLHSV